MHTVASTTAILRRRSGFGGRIRQQPVTEAMRGLDRIVTASIDECATQGVHVAAQRIAGLQCIAPHGAFEVCATVESAGLAHHGLEKLYAFRRKLHLNACEANL